MRSWDNRRSQLNWVIRHAMLNVESGGRSGAITGFRSPQYPDRAGQWHWSCTRAGTKRRNRPARSLASTSAPQKLVAVTAGSIFCWQHLSLFTNASYRPVYTDSP